MEMAIEREMSEMMKPSTSTSGIRLKLGTTGEGSLEKKIAVSFSLYVLLVVSFPSPLWNVPQHLHSKLLLELEEVGEGGEDYDQQQLDGEGEVGVLPKPGLKEERSFVSLLRAVRGIWSWRRCLP